MIAFKELAERLSYPPKAAETHPDQDEWWDRIYLTQRQYNDLIAWAVRDPSLFDQLIQPEPAPTVKLRVLGVAESILDDRDIILDFVGHIQTDKALVGVYVIVFPGWCSPRES
jgi:hypothetical protein